MPKMKRRKELVPGAVVSVIKERGRSVFLVLLLMNNILKDMANPGKMMKKE
ncbi:MAG: hypothetical protein GF308_09295 [Candidatus Heimdallarchaeota archaeon]|nr:hypothetical protein [Candidatus Heimdallarchaeota archaeon]